ncbi:MAG: hypothetical protein LBQ79_06410 [Deltaproteobacteria bacterium]|nr:hypothetical protein [Deltaproteobacteria bacterium]
MSRKGSVRKGIASIYRRNGRKNSGGGVIYDSWSTAADRLEACKQAEVDELTAEAYEIATDAEMSRPTEPTEKSLAVFKTLKMGCGRQFLSSRLVSRRRRADPIAADR